MSNLLSFSGLLIALAAGVSVVATPARQDPTPLYTAEQARTGGVVFARVCIECHETKAMSNADFRTKWSGQPAFALFELIRSTMPDGNPGSLSREEYAASVAYILKLNGLPAGTSLLPSDSAALTAITLNLSSVPRPSVPRPSVPRPSEKF